MNVTAHRLSVVALLLRVGLGAVWIWSAVVSEFVAPRAVSLGLLESVGFTDVSAVVLLHAASLLDLLLGLMTLAGWFVRPVAAAQAALIVGYSALLVGRVPELWAHPFAPIGKNIALIFGALALAVTGGGRWSIDTVVGKEEKTM
jgi:uncharacterized membrane protein YphA (DoxX/SURF4 family)